MTTRLAFRIPIAPLVAAVFAIMLAACTTPAPPAGEIAPPPPVVVQPPTSTRGEFLIAADKLDTWNAVGQIAVRTPGVGYEGRAQMLDLYILRYRGVEFMVLTKALPVPGATERLTRVTATTPGGKPIDHDAVAELLAYLQRELPAEIASVRARQAAERKHGARDEGARRK